MRYFFIPAMAVAMLAVPALAQVRVDPRGLGDTSLPPTPQPAPARPSRVPPAKPVQKPPIPQATAPAPVAPPGPEVPAYAPEAPVIPPPLAVPVRQAAPVTPAVISADAPGTASALAGGGLRVTFGIDRSDISAGIEAALKAIARSLPPDGVVTVTAFAPGRGDDQSAPRRLSLARAMTVRSVLLHEGIASARVYVRAQGGVPGVAGSGPVDRADVEPGAPKPLPQAPEKLVPGKQAP
jgi:outer membrane protein OmpA-like peptidoglycan-associated protein